MSIFLFLITVLSQTTNFGDDMGKGEKNTFGMNENWQTLWRTVWRFLKQLEIELPYDAAILPPCLFRFLKKI